MPCASAAALQERQALAPSAEGELVIDARAGENVGNVRQTRWEPLLRPSRAPDGRWTVDAWAPLDCRVANGGVRLVF